MANVVPDTISSLGFVHAPVSQFLVVASGISSVTVALLPRRYQILFPLYWHDVLRKREVWRLVTSQLVIDNAMDLVSNCVLIYYFLVLERRFGSFKYMSFVLKTWSLTLALYWVAMKSNLLDGFLNNIEFAPSGLYGPIYAGLVHYYCEIPKGENIGPFGLPISRKIFVYMVALQMLLNSPNTLLMCTCGIISGIVYRENLFSFQRWYVPESVTSLLTSLFDFLFSRSGGGEGDGVGVEGGRTTSKRVCMGATSEIHEDMVFDHMLRRQQQLHWRPNHATGRAPAGQGYSDIINPSFLNFFQTRPPVPPVPTVAPAVAPPAVETSDEKIRTLVDMGFSRDAVITALASCNNDVNQATTILLSP